MIHISLFSGIGGFEIAAEWMGWRNLVSCDINEFGNKIREYYWPDGYCHTDIKTLTYEKINSELSARFGSGWRDDDIILTGGFPCQPYSAAGKRLGKEDERHLWPEMLRVIQEVKPTYIVGENVRGLTNWNGGVVFEEVCANLEACGYEVQPLLLPACAVGAPHRRDRVWFVAYSASASERGNQLRGLRCQDGEIGRERSQTIHNAFRSDGIKGVTSNPNGNGLDQCDCNDEINTGQGGFNALGNTKPGDVNGDAADTESKSSERMRPQFGEFSKSEQREFRRTHSQMGNGDAADTECEGYTGLHKSWNKNNINRENANLWGGSPRRNQENYWQDFPTQSPICGGDDGIPTKLDGITFSKWRNESIKAYGNAIVPQVAFEIFKALVQGK
jgi:DNA (cytosine-5)-methyltransferase 1